MTFKNSNSAELRTIGLCDATTDSELSIRHLELTPNTSEHSFGLNPNASYVQKYSKESIDSGCQNETQNGEHIRNNDTWHHCDLNIVDISKDNCNNRMNTLDLAVNCRKSSSSTLSDASSCGTARSVPGEQRKRKDSPKYHSAFNAKSRLRRDTSISRSKSFQEQDVRKTSHSHLYITRRNQQNDFNDDYKLSKTISHHNIEITIEDTDAIEEPINHYTSMRQPTNKIKQNECSSINSSVLNYDRHKIRSGHILGRIFRRMRKLSMAWRKSKKKSRNRGEFSTLSLSHTHSFGFF